MDIPQPDLQRIADLYRNGQCLKAFAACQQFGPLKDWRGTSARLLAGRLAMNLGSPRLGMIHHYLAWRADPASPEALYYYARLLLDRRGPLATWEFLQGHGELPDAPEEVRADWWAFHGAVAARFRDFDTADRWLDRAQQLLPDHPWLWIERAYVLEMEDRCEESLAAARKSLELQPWYRPGVQAAAHGLELLDRDDEALKLLVEASAKLESGPVLMQLGALQDELQLYPAARATYERLIELSPLAEKEFTQWIAGRRADCACNCGDYDAALELAKQVDHPIFKKMVEKLADPADKGKRVLLPVPFVRQHHMTCAPATLSAISRFWSMPAEHLNIAEQICYDGTPDHSERNWAHEHGWAPWEFTVTWESAVALIDRGIPFTLATVEPGSAHLQAVVGYDSRRGTLILRDPSDRHWREAAVEPLLKRYCSTGPRGMALVPSDKAGLLAGIDLPDAALFDTFYDLRRALVAHNRPAAAAALDRMKQAAPDHRLTHSARRSLAMYDDDLAEILACTDDLLRLYPDDQILTLGKLASLRDLSRRDQRLELLKAACAKRENDPIFWQQYAQELAADAREFPKSVRLLRRAIRFRWADPGNLFILANILRTQRQFDRALQLYHFAACLDEKNEQLASGYFSASRYLKRTDDVLQRLRARFERFGRRSSQPARTLFWAYSELERMPDAFAVLDEAMALRPDDGELLLHAADAHGRYGQFDRAEQLLAKAKGRSQSALWLRVAAALASYRGQLKESLSLWRQIVDAQPLAMDAHRNIAQLLAETESRAAALAHLRAYAERFPYNCPLHRLWISWLGDDPAAAEPVIRHLIEIHPADAWAYRELAIVLERLGRAQDGMEPAAAAMRLEPTSPFSFTVRAALYRRLGQIDLAREDWRAAIRLSVDMDHAAEELLAACANPAERREELAFIKGELVRQVIFGDALLAYHRLAGDTLAPEELLASLREALDARPDLWHAWSGVTRQLVDMNRLNEARDIAKETVERFPLLPVAWLDLATVHQLAGDRAAEREALEQALQINPSWGQTIRRLATIYEANNDFAQARSLLEQAIARAPLDPANHGRLADVLWKLGEKEAALARLQHAIGLEPDYEWGWRMVNAWSQQLRRPELAPQLARELTVRRAGEVRSWLVLARILHDPRDLPERLAAVEKAISLDPRNLETHDLHAQLLAEARRYDGAIAACRPAPWGDAPPLNLRGREAWVHAQRGDLDSAIALMRKLLEEDPGYQWGWSRLADWLQQAEKHEECKKAAEMLVKLAPHEPAAFGYLADSKLRTGDRAGAMADFQHALKLNADYAYAGMCLFDLQLQDDHLDAAAETLQHLQRHVGGDFVIARAVELAARRKDLAAAQEGLSKLCISANEDLWPLRTAVDAMTAALWGAQARQILLDHWRHSQANPNLGRFWVEQTAKLQWWKEAERAVMGLQGDGVLARRTIGAYVGALADAKQARSLRRLIHERRDELRADTHLWGTVGHGLISVDDFAGVIEWLDDWRQRADAEPWMLVNLAMSLRNLGYIEAAAAVSRHALALNPDYTSEWHTLWLAADAAAGGLRDEARKLLDGVRCAGLDAYHQCLWRIVEATVTMGRERGDFKTARRSLIDAIAHFPSFRKQRALVRTYRRCAKEIARTRGGVLARLWYWGQWL